MGYNKTQTQSGAQTLYFNLAYVSFYLALKLGYINKTHTESGAKNSVFQFCLTTFSLFYLEGIKNYESLSVSLVLKRQLWAVVFLLHGF